VKQQGYTLIELLLVIAIISMISAFAIVAYRQNTENNRIDQAALEMQQVLEAAISYNVSSSAGAWPNANNALPNCVPPNLNDDFIKIYLPNQNFISNFGSNFCWDKVTNNPSLFWVALKMPYTDLNRNYQLANRIAAHLPSGVAITDPTQNDVTTYKCTTESANCYVRAEVTLPTATGGNGQVVGMGYCDPSKGKTLQQGSSADVTCTQNSPADHYTIKFACPNNGDVGQVYLVPNFYTAAFLGDADPSTIQTTLNAKTETDTCTEIPAGSSQYQCAIAITALFDSGSQRVVDARSGTIGATYIAYCTKPNQSTKTVTQW
jgi:prepilin-type N-terminal cleavage/methylation domain-containing protein